jgi:hypothetical protein
LQLPEIKARQGASVLLLGNAGLRLASKTLLVMRKNNIFWLGLLLVVGGIYFHYFTHWFEKREIAITASLRPSRQRGETVFPVFFTLNGNYKLTSVKVIPLEGDKFNPLAAPVWHLVSDSFWSRTRAFFYGEPIQGMKPALEGVRPEPLRPGVVYRLIVSAGGSTGHKDFKAKAIEE